MINWLESIRKELGALIFAGFGRRPFLRRAGEEGWLLVSDAPRRLSDPEKAKERIISAGYLLMEKDRLWFLDAPQSFYETLPSGLPKENAKLPGRDDFLPVWALVSLIRLHPGKDGPAQLWAARSILKSVEEGEKAVCGLADRMIPIFAVSLRKKEPLPQLAADLLNVWLWEQCKKEPSKC